MILTEASEEVLLGDDKQPTYVTYFVVIGATSRFGNNNVQIPQRNSITCNVPFNKYERSSVTRQNYIYQSFCVASNTREQCSEMIQ
jgi:hypothetical protein